MVHVKPALNALPPSEAPGEEMYFSILCDFGVALVEYRRAHNLTQKALADLLNVSQVMVSKYENGSFQVSLKVMCEICAKLKLSLDVRIGNPQPELPNVPMPGLSFVPVPVAALS